MTRDEFWELIANIDQDELAKGEDHAEEALQPLVAELAELSRKELRSFTDHLAECLYDLDTRRHFEASGDSRSDDAFLYARCYVVARGRRFYDRVVADPSRMPQSAGQRCEPLLYVSAGAWEENHDDDWEHETEHNYETGSNSSKW